MPSALLAPACGFASAFVFVFGYWHLLVALLLHLSLHLAAVVFAFTNSLCCIMKIQTALLPHHATLKFA